MRAGLDNETLNYILSEGISPKWIINIGGVEIPENKIRVLPAIRHEVTNGGNLAPGGSCISTVTVTLEDSDNAYSTLDLSKGTKASISLLYSVNGTEQLVQYGTYYVVDRKYTNYSVYITMMDAMYKLDESSITLSGDMTFNDVLTAILEDTDITVFNDEWAGKNINCSVNSRKLTRRQALQYLMAATGQFAFINYQNKLCIKWFDIDNINYDCSSYFSMDIKEAATYTGVQVIPNNPSKNDTEYITGETDRLFTMNNNFLITDDNYSDVKTLIYNAMVNKSFYTGTVGALFNPLIEVGDVIKTPDLRGQRGILPISAISCNGRIKEDLRCADIKEYEILDQRRKKEEKESNVEERLYECENLAQNAYNGAMGANSAVNAMNQSMSQALNGIYTSLDNKITETNSRIDALDNGNNFKCQYVLESDFSPSDTYANDTLIIVLEDNPVT